MVPGETLTIGLLSHYLSHQGGGVFEAVHRLARGLDAVPGVTSTLFGLADPNEAPGVEGVRVSNHPVHGPKGFGFAPSLVPGLEGAALDLLHVHGLWMYPSIASRRWAGGDRPLVISPHGMLDPWAVRHAQWKKRLAGLAYEHGHLRRANCLHALCEPEAEAIRAFGLEQPIAVIPNGVDRPDWDQAAPPAPWAGSVPEGSRVLLFLGRLHRKKNLMALLEAWQMWRAQVQGPERDAWWLVIAGWDQAGYRAGLEAWVRETGVRQVELLGPQFGAGKTGAFRHASAFVLPSVSEGLPMAVLEAWAYRLPVLMTEACHLPIGFEEGAAIRIGTEPAEMAQGIEALAGLPEADRRGLGARGEQLVAERYTWPRVAERLTAVYRWLLGSGEPPADVIDTDARPTPRPAATPGGLVP